MKIKRFYAETMRLALKQVREEQGPDAVILSNSSVEGGVEVVAAIDYDESLFHQSLGSNSQQPAARPAETGAQSSPIGANASSSTSWQPDVWLEPDPEPRISQSSRTSLASEADPFNLQEPIAILREPNATPDQRQPETRSPTHSMQSPSLDDLNAELKSLRSLMQEQISQTAFDKLQHQRPAIAPIIRRLEQARIDPKIIESLVDIIPTKADERYAWRTVLALLSKRLSTTEQNICDNGGNFALVGPTGVGKTTTVAKLAAAYTLNHGNEQVALISTDSAGIGAQEQLLRIGKILGIPVRIATDQGALQQALQAFSNKSLVLIDTAGYGQRDPKVVQQLAMLNQSRVPVKTLLTLSANTQTECINESIERFSCVDLYGAVITKVDEAVSFGGLLSAMISTQLKICYLTDGQEILENLHFGSGMAAGLISRAIKSKGSSQAAFKPNTIYQHDTRGPEPDPVLEEQRVPKMFSQAAMNG